MKAPPTPKPPAELGVFPGFDEKAAIARLNGKWAVTTSLNSKAFNTWTVKDGAVTIEEPEGTITGILTMPFPGRVMVRAGERHTTSVMDLSYPYTYNADTAYIGRGVAGQQIGDYCYGATEAGVAVFDGIKCHFHVPQQPRRHLPPLRLGAGPRTSAAQAPARGKRLRAARLYVEAPAWAGAR